jgi:putative cell wall-binding protein
LTFLFASLLAVTAAIGVAPPRALAVGGQTFVQLANVKRASIGLGPVSFSSAIDQVSVERVAQMVRSDSLTHDLAYVQQRFSALGICYSSVGEIIAWSSGGTYDPQMSIDAWWKSAPHHAIMVGDYNAAAGAYKGLSASGKTYAVMLFAKLCSPPAESTSSNVTRVAGSDRYATAAAVSRSAYGASVPVAYVATGATFPDALAAAPAAAKAGGPVLLTARDSLPSVTAAELSRLKPGKIVLVGGTGVISDNVRRAVGAYTSGSVVRLAGADRYATAAAVSRASFAAGVPVAYVATGAAFADAESGGAAAGRQRGPVLLVSPTSIPSATATELGRLRPQRIVVLGGSGAVSSSVAAALDRYTSGSVSRLSGADRYATAVAVSRSTYGSTAPATVYVATGVHFPDGLTGAPVAALAPGPLLLVKPDALPSSVASELRRLGADEVVVLGSTGAISDSVLRAIKATTP